MKPGTATDTRKRLLEDIAADIFTEARLASPHRKRSRESHAEQQRHAKAGNGRYNCNGRAAAPLDAPITQADQMVTEEREQA